MKLVAGLVIAGTLIVVMVIVAAQQGDAGAAGRSDGIVFEDMRFVPNRLDAKVGVPLRVRLTNNGTERHDLNFPSLHMPGLEGVQSILEPGETRTVTLTFSEPGTHSFSCSLPGHAAAGMTGAVFVTP